MTFTLLLIVLQGLASTDNWTCDTTFARLGSYSLRYCSVSGVVRCVAAALGMAVTYPESPAYPALGVLPAMPALPRRTVDFSREDPWGIGG